MSELRRDPITGALSVHTDTRGKAFAHPERRLPETSGKCPFCSLATSGVEVDDDGYQRTLHYSGEHVFSVENRWNPVGDYGVADLVVPRRHVSAIEDLSDEEIPEFFEAMGERRSAQGSAWERSATFINVGLDSGSTQPHLHAQVVSAGFGTGESRGINRRSVAEDYALAVEHDLVVTEYEGASAYVAWAPGWSGELRVVANDWKILAPALLDTLRHVSTRLGPLSYNVSLHEGGVALARVILRLRSAISIYPEAFGVVSCTVVPAELAATLQ